MAKIEFFVPGRPKSTQTGSVVIAGGRAFPTRRGMPWSALCGLYARQFAPPEPLKGPLVVALCFLFQRPRHSQAGKRGFPTVRPDLDGLQKGLLDQWNGVLWEDDAQIVSLDLKKEYTPDGQPGVRVLVESLESHPFADA